MHQLKCGKSLVFVLVAVWCLTVSTPTVATPARDAGQAALPPELYAETNVDSILNQATQSVEGRFVENVGQLANSDVRFYASVDGVQVGFSESRILYNVHEQNRRHLEKWRSGADPVVRMGGDVETSRGAMIQLMFEGAAMVSPIGNDELSYRSNYFIGNDPGRWKTAVRSFREVLYTSLYPGIDLVFKVTRGGLKYEYVVHPHAQIDQIRMVYVGAEAIEIDTTGELVLRTQGGSLREAAPVAFQDSGDIVSCRFAPFGRYSVGFECNHWNPFLSLTIDPLVYSSFIGGSQGDEANSIAVDDEGAAYVTGLTGSPDFPTTPGAYDRTWENIDAFILKLKPDGSDLLYSTFLGGNGFDEGLSIAVDSDDVDLEHEAYVVGGTSSPDFPVNPWSADHEYENGEAFFVHLGGQGDHLDGTTFLGGNRGEMATSITLDSSDRPYIVGFTVSSNFPLENPFDSTCGTDGNCNYDGMYYSDAFLVELDWFGSMIAYSTYLGGSYTDEARSVVVDSGYHPYVVGITDSADFPVTAGAYDESYNGHRDAFVSEFYADGTGLHYSTYIGGAGVDDATSVALDQDRNTYITGWTTSSDFPVTPGAYSQTLDDYCDVFVTKLDNTGSILVYSTYLGGSGQDYGFGVAVDAMGKAYVVGRTSAPDFPTTPGAFDDSFNGGEYDAFIAELNEDCSDLVYSTFLGGSGFDDAYSVRVDCVGCAFIAGTTLSPDFPVTPGAYDPSYNWAGDTFVMRVSLLPSGPLRLFEETSSEWFTDFGSPPSSVTAADVDGDGKTEILTAGTRLDGAQIKGELRIWRWECSSLTLEKENSFFEPDVKEYVFSVTSGDVDGDDKVEIVTAGYFATTGIHPYWRLVVRIWEWDGATLTQDGEILGGDSTAAVSVVTADVNGNGIDEIFLTGSFADVAPGFALLQIYEWIGGSFVKVGEEYWTTGEDGSIGYDIAVGEASYIPAWPPEVVVVGYAADYAGNRKTQMSIWTWNGGGLGPRHTETWSTWSPDQAYYSVSIDDIDGGGHPDIVAVGTAWSVQLGRYFSLMEIFYWNGVDFHWENGVLWSLLGDSEAFSVFVGDVDEDVPKEIIMAGYSVNEGTMKAYFGLFHWDGFGTPEWEISMLWTPGGDASAQSVFALDVEPDHDSEILIVGSVSGSGGVTRQLTIWNWNT